MGVAQNGSERLLDGVEYSGQNLTPSSNAADKIRLNSADQPQSVHFDRGPSQSSTFRAYSQPCIWHAASFFETYSCRCSESNSVRHVSLNSLNGSLPFAA